MRADLERELAARVRAEEFPRDVVQSMIDRGAIRSWKEAGATLEKWMRRGWWEFGTNVFGGWFTPEAPASPDDVRQGP